MIRSIQRVAVNLVVSLLVLLVCQAILPGFKLANVLDAILGVAIVGILNSEVRPTIVRLTLPLTVLSFGSLAIVLNGVFILIASWLDPGFHVANLLTAIAISFALTVANMVVTSSLLLSADRELHEYHVIQRFARKKLPSVSLETPGLLLIEIDGLSEPLIRQAIDDGHMPTLAEWLRSGRYQLVGWDTGLPAQTSAMQAGILHGSHYNIPAFRFYDKRSRRLLVSGHPPDAADMLKGIADGNGLLRSDGFSVNNWAHGDANDVVLTMSMLAGKVGGAVAQSDDLFGYFANAYTFQRGFVKFVRDVFVELWEAWLQRRRNVQPRVARRFPYPFVRALTTALLPDLSCYLLIQKMFEGIEVAYSTLVSYDEVAHHSGIDRPDALRVLGQIDRQIRWVAKAGEITPRRYDIVVLSDHGQSQGATFRQRYGMTLQELVTSLLATEYAPEPAAHHEEGIDRVRVLVAQLAQTERRRAQVLQRAIGSLLARGPAEGHDQRMSVGTTERKTVVCASGNLGLIYFAEWPGRLTLEQIESRFPDLVAGLVNHPGIGFILALSEADGPIVLGKCGRCRLRDGSVDGENPLAPYGLRAANHLRDVSDYPNQADLVVNSFYDPATGEVAAFEELVGSHGGLGGWQNRPFLLFPTRFGLAGQTPDLVGAPAIHRTLREWRVIVAVG